MFKCHRRHYLWNRLHWIERASRIPRDISDIQSDQWMLCGLLRWIFKWMKWLLDRIKTKAINDWIVKHFWPICWNFLVWFSHDTNTQEPSFVSSHRPHSNFIHLSLLCLGWDSPRAGHFIQTCTVVCNWGSGILSLFGKIFQETTSGKNIEKPQRQQAS